MCLGCLRRSDVAELGDAEAKKGGLDVRKKGSGKEVEEKELGSAERGFACQAYEVSNAERK